MTKNTMDIAIKAEKLDKKIECFSKNFDICVKIYVEGVRNNRVLTTLRD
jgi:hypothetical protein